MGRHSSLEVGMCVVGGIMMMGAWTTGGIGTGCCGGGDGEDEMVGERDVGGEKTRGSLLVSIKELGSL